MRHQCDLISEYRAYKRESHKRCASHSAAYTVQRCHAVNGSSTGFTTSYTECTVSRGAQNDAQGFVISVGSKMATQFRFHPPLIRLGPLQLYQRTINIRFVIDVSISAAATGRVSLGES
eukprot:scaffold38788_cov221-Amphora_coffeaeformis.AAC.3